MDRKSLTILVVSIALLFLLSPLIDKLYPPVKRPISTNQVASVTNTATTQSNAATSTTSSAPAMPTPSGPEKTLVVTNNNIVWHMTSRGGGISLIEMAEKTPDGSPKYAAAIACSRDIPAETNFASVN